MAAGGSTHHQTIHAAATSKTKASNGIAMDDDGDNRTRNAKAQRRHREKRKAHLKGLEETTQLLSAQLEDARRQIGQAQYGHRLPQAPLSPGSKSFADLQAENAFLRDENTELRRQLYRYAGTYGQVGAEDMKPDGYQYAPIPQPMASPREGSSRDGQKSAQYPPGNPPDSGDHFSRGSRSRVMSSSSSQAPGASPYMQNSTAFPTDPRAHSLNQPQSMDRYPPLRYESHVYPSPANHSPTGGPPQPPPHNLPRSGMSYGVDMYGGHRPESDPSWGPDQSGPPPFQGSVYPVTYGDGPAQDEWRAQGHDEQQQHH